MHHYRIVSLIAAAIAAAWTPASHAQTATGTTTTTATATSGTTTASGTTSTGTTATTGTTGTAGTTATSGSPSTGTTGATTVTLTESESRYLARLESRYPGLASKTNLESLVHGLRTGSAITLTSTQPAAPGATTTTTTTSTTFTPPTRPMGYGNITRAMTLATRQLSASGVTNPTPQQLQTALMGGTLTTAQGSVQMQGVLQLRSEGMGWGQIAHSIGVQPGMGAASASSRYAGTTDSTTGTTSGTAAGTATGATTTTSKTAAARITTAGGGTVASGRTQHSTEVRGRGIVTAAGTAGGSVQYRGHGHAASSRPVIAASGAGVTHGGGHGAGGVRAHGGKP